MRSCTEIFMIFSAVLSEDFEDVLEMLFAEQSALQKWCINTFFSLRIFFVAQ